ncbi:hypothetical protein [Aurantibacter sp.]|uniref:hypothetical protein n=1 Tax=Aurantibacter sp. TaxID=2807103 RepID=UPI003264C4DB
MKNKEKYIVLMLVLLNFWSCVGEVKEKLSKAKQTVSNTTTLIDKVQEAKEDIEHLKSVQPLTNDDLKNWLPVAVNSFNRTGFKVGLAGFANVASIEGVFKLDNTNQKFKVNIIDGAGPAGSMVIAGLDMAANMDMEQEDESIHLQAVNANGIQAQQTFYKKRNETSLQFVVDKRFGVIVNGVNINPDNTWKLVDELNLDVLSQIME